MPIDSKHPEYLEWCQEWERCRDAMRGRQAVRTAGRKYLPWSSARPLDEFHEYADRAVWFGATERTVKGLAGAVTRKSTAVEVPRQIEEDLEDLDLAGTDFDSLLLSLVQEQLLTSRLALEVNLSPEAKRPFWVLWPAESIVNWSEARVNGRIATTLVILRDSGLVPRGDDPYMLEEEVRYRELALLPAPGTTPSGVVCRERVFVKGKAQAPGNPDRQGGGWVMVSEVFPARRGQPLDFVPVVPIGATAARWGVEKPALLDLVDLNLADWRNSADYEAALSCLRPVYYAFGVPAGTEIRIGSDRAITSPEPGASAGILNGADPVGLRTAMAEKRSLMATLGARMLEDQPDVQETATAVQLRHSGEQASLRTIADTMALAVTRALEMHAWWAGLEGAEVEVTPNKDFVAAGLPPDTLRAYMELHQAHLISYETFYSLLQAGEVTRAGVTVDEELAAIEAEVEDELQAAPDGQQQGPPPEGVTPPQLEGFVAAMQTAKGQGAP